jgi:hypothetical protein
VKVEPGSTVARPVTVIAEVAINNASIHLIECCVEKGNFSKIVPTIIETTNTSNKSCDGLSLMTFFMFIFYIPSSSK